MKATAERPASETDPRAAGRNLARGVVRLLADMGFEGVAEVPLSSGRRVDVMAVDAKGRIAIAEVKVSVADFRADAKWPHYRDHADLFYFAVPHDFPRDVLPPDCGLLVGDRFGAEVVRPAPALPLVAARRKAVLLRFARTAAARLREAGERGPGCSTGARGI